MNKLIVRKEGGMFVLRAFRDGKVLETVKAFDAQMILDYLNATGRSAQWIILAVAGSADARPRIKRAMQHILPL